MWEFIIHTFGKKLNSVALDMISSFLNSFFPFRILQNLLHIGTEEHVYRSLFGEHQSPGKKTFFFPGKDPFVNWFCITKLMFCFSASSSNFFSFTRFIDLSPAQLSAMMLKGLVFRWASQESDLVTLVGSYYDRNRSCWNFRSPQFSVQVDAFLFSFQVISLSFSFKRNKRSSPSAFLGPETEKRKVSYLNSNREPY